LIFFLFYFCFFSVLFSSQFACAAAKEPLQFFIFEALVLLMLLEP